MRRGAIGLAASLGLALALCCASLASAASHPAGKQGELPARVAGAVTIAWHGDPARGCAAAGACDVSGSLVYAPDQASFNVLKLPNEKFFPAEILMGGIGDSAVVRVRRDPPGGTPSLCVDTVQVPFMLVNATPVAGGRYRFDFSDQIVMQTGLSSGRCAGPLPHDLRGALPSGVLDMNALRHGSALLNMSSRKAIAFGPYRGEVVSTFGVRVARFSRFDREGGDIFETLTGGGSRGGRRVRVLEVGVKYRITSMNGALRTNFSGVDGPMCGTLDACGLSGTIDYTTSATGGELFLAGVRRLRHGERRPTLSSALRELKAGRLLTGGYGAMRPDSTAKVFATVSRPGDTTCTDTATPAIPPLDLFGAGRTMHFLMDLPDELIVDGLRTRCPGPMETDTLAQGPLAAGHVAAARLGARTISVSLSRPGTFTSDPYSGTRSGAIELRLVRNGVKEKVIHVRKSEAP